MPDRTYIAIDLKSFYASVECVERGLDPLTTNLVVADDSRTEKTICLAVSPTLKALGISGRARLFEVVQKVREANLLRKRNNGIHVFHGESVDSTVLASSHQLSIGYITAKPRMALYIEYSARIYDIYLKFFSQDDIHVYSIDEVFIDATGYLALYRQSAHELALTAIRAVLEATGITATAGIGPNLYLAKVAMDVMAKKIPADKDGVRIAELDEMTYRRQFWSHRPITDFWRVGKGYAERLEKIGIKTMGDIARCSLQSENLLYNRLGVNAELLIDHAWGWEPCTIADIKAYMPSSHSLGMGQVLHCPYDFDKARIVAREMAQDLALDLFAKRLVTKQVVLTVGYDVENLGSPVAMKRYHGEISVNRYGKQVPKSAHGTQNLDAHTASMRVLDAAVVELFERIVDKNLSIRRLNLTASNVIPVGSVPKARPVQLSLLSSQAQQKQEESAAQADAKRQQAILDIRQKYGKNALLKGLNLQEGATGKDRNQRIGGHQA